MEITALQACKADLFSQLQTISRQNYMLLAQLQNNKALNDEVQTAAINSAREGLSYEFNSCIDQAAIVCGNPLLHTLRHDTSLLYQDDRAALVGRGGKHAQALHTLMNLSSKIHSATEYLDRAFEKKIAALQCVQKEHMPY